MEVDDVLAYKMVELGVSAWPPIAIEVLTGAVAEILVAGNVPDGCIKPDVHTMIMQDDVMVMRPVEDPLVIEAGAMLELQPGGLHLMFMQLEQPHVAGESLDVVLVFEHAGERTVTLEVLSMRDSMERMAQSSGSHSHDDHDSGHSDHDSGHSDHDSGHSHN